MKVLNKLVILTVMFLVLTLMVLFRVTEGVDIAVYNFFVGLHTDFLLNVFNVITSLASEPIIIIITLVLIFLLNTNYKRLFVLINTLVSAAVILVSKNIFLRERPFIGQELIGTYSYPSGHSLIATTYYGFLIYLVNKSNFKDTTKKILTVFLAMIIVLVSLSRVVLGVHYLTDVLGGVILGFFFLFLIIYSYEKYLNPKVKEKPLLKTLSYGFNGIIYTLTKERNMVIHFLVMLLVIIAGIVFKISFLEWLICFVLFALVLSLELMNTALENVVDLVTSEKKAKAKVAKDAAAGAVLVAAIFAIIIGIGIFLPKFLSFILAK